MLKHRHHPPLSLFYRFTDLSLYRFSGDGDFQRVVQAVQRQGCRVIVISSSKTSASSIADELRRQADDFIDLTAIASEIRMPER